MKVFCIKPTGFECNSYAVTQDGKNCVMIDCPSPEALAKAWTYDLYVKAVFLTHGHFDHMAGCAAAHASGAPVYCGEGEKNFMFSPENKAIFGLDIPAFPVEKELKDGEEIELYGIKIKAVSTPGHTPGGVSYIVGDTLFSGDILFKDSIGRSDFAGGDLTALTESVKKLYAIKGNLRVLSGHGEETSLNYERKNNPYVRG